MRYFKQLLCCILICSILFSGINITAATKAKLITKKVTITVGKKRGIKLKGKVKKAKYLYSSSNKKVATVSKKGIITARKNGTAKIVVREKIANTKRKLGKVKVTCKKKKKPSASAPAVSKTPSITTTPTLFPSPVPTQTPEPTPDIYDTPDDFDQTLSGVTYGTLSRKNYYSTITEKQRNVNIILPPNYSEEKQYPVLYLLHGIGGDENEWLSGNPRQIIGNMNDADTAKEMILVIPNVRCRANDAANPSDCFTLEHYHAFDNFIHDLKENLMPYIEENYSIATGRENTAIAGLSMGGRESLYIGLSMPETFGYIAAFSPGYGVFAYTANGVSEPGLFTKDSFTLPEAYKNNTLILINNGISEGGENAIGGDCHRALEQNEVPHKFYVTTGGHDFTVWKNGLYNFALRIFK